MKPREVRRADPGPQATGPRVHPIPGTRLTVEWDQPWEAYVVDGPGAPQGTGPLASIEDLASALAPVPLPAPVRTALAADRALHPPIADAWRRRVDMVRAVLAPLGTALRTVSPYILGAETSQAVHVQIDPGIGAAAERARQLVEQAGYRMLPHHPQAGVYLVLSGVAAGTTGETDR